jgi:hypothetical protein
MNNLLESIKDRKIRPSHSGEIILDILGDVEIS